jgi:sodium/hydrogen antiporter
MLCCRQCFYLGRLVSTLKGHVNHLTKVPLRFRLETLDDSLQPTIDMLLNLSIFIWYGAVCPWASFRLNDVIPTYRLVFLGVLILLFRRVPVVLGMHKYIPEIEHFQQAAFVGFFGPIGVSAIFYLYVSIDFLNAVTVDGTPTGAVREDARHLQDVMRIIIWFLAICSIVVHGLSVPIGKLGYHLPRTVSSAFTTSMDRDEPDQQFQTGERIDHKRSMQGSKTRQRRNPNERPQNAIFRVGGSAGTSRPRGEVGTPIDEPDRPINFISGSNSAFQSPLDSPRPAKSRGAEDLPTLQDNGAVLRRMRTPAGTSSGETAVTSSGEDSGGVPEADSGK